mmetsp:Transcript_13504/g.19853  ORF Transcript_13504/g.19853 Transcript_13504/m.19853 type:complete len:433 (-) Transcript_13504:206-1504(-)
MGARKQKVFPQDVDQSTMLPGSTTVWAIVTCGCKASHPLVLASFGLVGPGSGRVCCSGQAVDHPAAIMLLPCRGGAGAGEVGAPAGLGGEVGARALAPAQLHVAPGVAPVVQIREGKRVPVTTRPGDGEVGLVLHDGKVFDQVEVCPRGPSSVGLVHKHGLRGEAPHVLRLGPGVSRGPLAVLQAGGGGRGVAGAGCRLQAALGLALVRGVQVAALAHLEYAHDPVLGCEGLIHGLQSDVLDAHFTSTRTVESWGFVVLRLHLPEAIVTQLVGHTVLEGLRGTGPHIEGTLIVEEVVLVGHVVGIHPGPDADGPEELVDVVAGVPGKAPKDHQHVVHVQALQDRVGRLLRGGQGTTHGGDVGVVPGVVVHQHRAVGHGGHLVPVVPPAQDLGGRVRVLAQPEVRFPVVVIKHPAAIRSAPSINYNGRGGVGQ